MRDITHDLERREKEEEEEVNEAASHYKNKILGTSGQDEGIGRHTAPPCTTKRRTFKNKKTTRTARKPNCMEVRQPRS